MNIAFFVGSFPVLSETFILNQITGLIDRGHAVDIYAKKILDPQTSHEDVLKYRLRDITFPHGEASKETPKNYLLRTMKTRSYLTRKDIDSKILINSLNVLNYGLESLSLRLFYRAVTFLQSSKKYDIVHCHFGPNGLIAIDLKMIGAIDSKVVTTFHGSDITQYIKRKGENIYARLFKNGDIFLPISEKWKSKLIELGCEERKIKVHRMGIDTKKFTMSSPRPVEDNTTSILSVGRLVPKKGIAHGIEAVAKLLKKHPNTMYSIVGDGPLREELEDMIATSGTGDRIKILGWKTQDEVVELMKAAHIFLAPSITDERGNQEGLPVVLMEAQALGMPVVSTFHSGIPELVRDGLSGFLVPEGDVAGMEEKLEYLVENPAIGFAMGREGSKCVSENFDINKLNDRLIEIYESLLDGDRH